MKVSPNPVYAGEKITIAFTVDTTEADKVQKEIDLMKTGSIGLVSQITTISKIRITKPLHYSDAFAGIKLSDESLKYNRIKKSANYILVNNYSIKY